MGKYATNTEMNPNSRYYAASIAVPIIRIARNRHCQPAAGEEDREPKDKEENIVEGEVCVCVFSAAVHQAQQG